MFDRGERSIAELARSVSAKKTRLSEMSEAAGPHVFESLDQAQHAHIVFTSNSLEGNSLTAGETSLILEKGIAVGGKSLRDHMEVIDHSQTLEWVEDVVKEDTNKRRPPRISVTMLTVMNSMLLQRTKSDNLSSYTKKRTDGTYESDIDNPPPSMLDFGSWLKGQADNPESACDAHNRLAHIQPFIAGNGPTARLLMNYILMRGGYPPIAIYERDLSRSAVIANAYTISHNTLFERLDATLDLYLNAAEQALAVANQKIDGEH